MTAQEAVIEVCNNFDLQTTLSEKDRKTIAVYRKMVIDGYIFKRPDAFLKRFGYKKTESWEKID